MPASAFLARAVFLLALAGACGGTGVAGEVQVAVASNFTAALTRLSERFNQASGHTLKLSSGATGKFYVQIKSGAPFDVLLAADDETPARLVSKGHAVGGTAFTYAVGRLVLWSAKPGYVDQDGAILAMGRFKHLAIANPKVAPYGAAAIEVLRARGLAEKLAPRLVLGESIAQAYQFVATENAELGFVALSQVMTPGRPASGSLWRVPAELHRPLRQDAVLLKKGQANPAAVAFLAYLKGDAARSVIESFGYGR